MKYRLKPEYTKQVSCSDRMAREDFTDPSCLLLQTARAPSFAFLQEMSWAAWARAAWKRVKRSSLAQGILCAHQLLTVLGKRKSPKSYRGKCTQSALVSCKLSDLKHFAFPFPFMGYFSLRTTEQLRREKH